MIVRVNKRFSALLGEKRLKISTVAKETNISRSTITNLYYGRSHGISFKVLGRLCEYLECSPGDIIEQEKKED